MVLNNNLSFKGGRPSHGRSGRSGIKFKPHDNVIDLLIGERLYTTSDAAIRELIQNAEDACALQRLADPLLQPRIAVEFSVASGWVRVVDNGLGMNEEALEKSFSAVGAPKDEVSHIKELLAQSGPDRARQIAQFGIGVLSCFGVAETIEVRTKMDKEEGLAFRIRNYHDEWEELPDLPAERGTSVHLILKPDGSMKAEDVPAAVTRYARHAPHVELHNVDADSRQPIAQTWQGAENTGAMQLVDPALSDGYLGLQPNLEDPGAALRSDLIVCNGGFLVSERELTLISPSALGYVGEIDVRPGALTINLNRESFQHDSSWVELGQRLLVSYNELLRKRVQQWRTSLESNDSSAEFRPDAIERIVLILGRGPTASVLEADVLEAINQLVPRVARIKIWRSEELTSIEDIVATTHEEGKIYFTTEGQAARQFQQAVNFGGQAVQLTETAQTESLRADHLQARGFRVVVCRNRSYNAEFGGASQGLTISDAELLSTEATRRGISVMPVESAALEDVQLDAAEQSGLFSDLLNLGEELKLISLSESQEKVIRDFAGRLLNATHPEVQEVLRALPRAVGNPVRRALLKAYMDIDNFRMLAAQQTIKELLVSSTLAEDAQLMTGELLRKYLETRLDALLERPQEDKSVE